MSQACFFIETIIRKLTLYEHDNELVKPFIESFVFEFPAHVRSIWVEQSDFGFPNRLATIKFVSLDRAKAFLPSEEYKPFKNIRLELSKATLSIGKGV